jgi:cytochrome c oxidase assembly protein subunit 15
MLSVEQRRYNRQIAYWLLACATVIFGMIILGGVTRLTHSGLSMVEWRPLVGIIPPLSQADWLEVFEKYKLYPEYQKINFGMSLDEFKYIFMYEYLHRVLGRIIGIIYFIPMVYFFVTQKVANGFKRKLFILLIMGGLQGLMGWFMVMSGLVDNPRVSQYRLTAHLGLAVLIYAYMFWLALDLLLEPVKGNIHNNIARFSKILLGLIYFMILTGGLVAGIRAGFAYNTWPLMGEWFFPPGLFPEQLGFAAVFEDITTVQFNHRMFAYFLTVCIVVFVYKGTTARMLSGKAHTAMFLLLLALIFQVGLGISTLIYMVPVPLAAAHQGGAVVLLTAALYVAHRLTDLRQWRSTF